MKSRALLLAAATSLALSGCATMETAKSGASCNENVCHIRLNITSCKPSGSAITAYPDEAHIGRGSHEIHWDIASTGYEFTANGITFKKPAGSVFTSAQKLTGTKYKWHDNNTAPGRYDYNIEVMSASGSVCRCDPTIVND